MSHAGKKNRHGFSLVEVIVIIAIASILLGLLAPALSSVRAAGRGNLCRNNLRQLSIAAHVYANTHQAFPPALTYAVQDGVAMTVAWDWVTTFAGELISPGPLWNYVDSPHEVMQCPEYFGSANAPGDPHSGFNYSVYLGGEQRLTDLKFFPGARPHAVRRPSTCAMFGCGGYAGGANKFMRSPVHNDHSGLWLPLSTIYSGGQAFRYRGRTFVAHVDGHVGMQQHAMPGVNATDSLLYSHMGHPKNGFLSDEHEAYSPY